MMYSSLLLLVSVTHTYIESDDRWQIDVRQMRTDKEIIDKEMVDICQMVIKQINRWQIYMIDR